MKMGRFRCGFLGVISLVVLVTACRTIPGVEPATAVPLEPGLPPPTATSTAAATRLAQQASSAAVKATPIPPGLSRTDPLPFLETAVSPHWEVNIREILRGDEAWQIIQSVNPFNKPAGDGWEYLLLNLQIRNTYTDDGTHRLSLTVTGDRRVTHYSFNASVVVPEPRLEMILPGGAAHEGWLPFRIHYGEENLMLVMEDGSAYDEPARYLALSKGAAVETETAVLSAITPTSLGTDLSQPAPPGQTTTSDNWQVTLLAVTRGEAAWQAIYETNQFNDPPLEGMEYLLLRVRVRYIGAKEQGQSLTDRAFFLTDRGGKTYPRPVVVQPPPDLLARLFPGGETEGIIVHLAEAQRKNLVLVFESPVYGAAADTRYFSLGDYGR